VAWNDLSTWHIFSFGFFLTETY